MWWTRTGYGAGLRHAASSCAAGGGGGWRGLRRARCRHNSRAVCAACRARSPAARVCQTAAGAAADALAAPQALVDSPEITRTIINFKRLLLTDLTVEIGKIPNKKELAAALKTAGAPLTRTRATACWTALAGCRACRLRSARLLPGLRESGAALTLLARCAGRTLRRRTRCHAGWHVLLLVAVA
jgi:hypothetical protein